MKQPCWGQPSLFLANPPKGVEEVSDFTPLVVNSIEDLSSDDVQGSLFFREPSHLTQSFTVEFNDTDRANLRKLIPHIHIPRKRKKTLKKIVSIYFGCKPREVILDLKHFALRKKHDAEQYSSHT